MGVVVSEPLLVLSDEWIERWYARCGLTWHDGQGPDALRAAVAEVLEWAAGRCTPFDPTLTLHDVYIAQAAAVRGVEVPPW